MMAVRIGVTGHRTLENEPALEALVLKALALQTLSAASRTGQVIYTILSCLAEGADRLVARVLLQHAGAKLEAVLPLTLDDYLKDFRTPASRNEFYQLLAECSAPVFLRAAPIRDDSDDPKKQAELRNAAYEAAGRYVVDHCDVLFALWDGRPSRGRGGTTEIVAYARKQRRRIIRIWDGECTILSPDDSRE
jgi:hypothetical protein